MLYRSILLMYINKYISLLILHSVTLETFTYKNIFTFHCSLCCDSVTALCACQLPNCPYSPVHCCTHTYTQSTWRLQNLNPSRMHCLQLRQWEVSVHTFIRFSSPCLSTGSFSWKVVSILHFDLMWCYSRAYTLCAASPMYNIWQLQVNWRGGGTTCETLECHFRSLWTILTQIDKLSYSV